MSLAKDPLPAAFWKIAIPAAVILTLATPAAAAGASGGTEATTMTGMGAVLLGLTILLGGAKLAGEVFERLGFPAVLGELLLGIGLGNLGAIMGIHALEFLKDGPGLALLAEIGVILLLFAVGLESNLRDMAAVGLSSLLVAILGVVVPSFLGIALARYWLPAEPWFTHVFIGTILCATSVGITARVLKDLGRVDSREGRIILGAAVIDDVLGLVVLSVVSALIASAAGAASSANGSTLGAGGILWIAAKAVLFLGLAIGLGRLLAPFLFRAAARWKSPGILLALGLTICFFFAWTAQLPEIGLAPIVGAFAAGLVLDEVHWTGFTERGEHGLNELVQPLVGFLAPVFFVSMGLTVDLRSLASREILGFAILLTLVAILGKQVCALGVIEKGVSRLAVGVGMIPRGEVGLIFAAIGTRLTVIGADGSSHPVVSPAIFSAAVFMVVATTLLTPPLLKLILARGDRK